MSQSILHTVNQSPFNKNTLKQCLDCYSEGDGILLLEDGVYGALSSQPLANHLNAKNCYAIGADIQARGLNEQSLIQYIKTIDFQQFVQLCTQYDLVQSWY